MYTKMITDVTVADGIINEIKNDDNVKLILTKWPGRADSDEPYRQTLKQLTEESNANLAVLNDRGIKNFHNILVPVGGGLNSRLAIHLANDIARQEGSHVNYVRVSPLETDEEEQEDKISYLQEIVMTQLGQVPPNSTLQIRYAASIEEAVIEECKLNDYELIIIGSAYDVTDGTLFGQVCDNLVEKVPYSVMVVRRHESAPASWLHHQVKRIWKE
jgi:nucleotide-binding universal stress UspA family protein